MNEYYDDVCCECSDYDYYDDVCYECSGYGDDYFINDEGELECYCPQCSFNPSGLDDWDD